MAQTKRKVLFITPAADRTGANVFLLNFLRWFKENSDIPFVTLYTYTKDLEKEFGELSKTFQYYYPDKFESPLVKRAFNKLANRLEIKRFWLRSLILRENIGLIFSNTIANHKMLSLFDDLDVPVITQCLELESQIRFFSNEDFNYTKDRTSEFIAFSDAVRRNLVENHHIPNDKIEMIRGSIPIRTFTKTDMEKRRKMLCSELDIPENAFIVGASGTLYWRKAPEMFIQIARDLIRKNPEVPIYFVWIGGAEKGDIELMRMNFDIERSGLKNRIFFLEHKADPLIYYAGIDVFAMVSRDEALGLVCLEAASLNKPVICFENTGGAPEFVQQDCGFIVPYFNLEIFVEKILELYKNPKLKEKLGENAARKVLEKYDIQTNAPKILKIIENNLNL